MKNILKKFYYGNLSPANKQIVKGSAIAHAIEEQSKAEDLLEQAIPPDLLPILKRLTDAQITHNSLTAETYYLDGFKTGARFMLAVQDDTCENLEPIKA